jgi:hypothetical protein
MEVDQILIQMPHPSGTIDDDHEDDSENQNSPIVTINSLARIKRIRENEEAIANEETVNGLLRKNFKFNENLELKLDLDLDRKKVVKFAEELVLGLDLTIQSSSKVGFLSKTKKFAQDITYNTERGNDFRNQVISNKGYLFNEKNYFFVDDRYTMRKSNVVTLTNSRVILFWRGVKLDDDAVKRIITLGLGYLIKTLTYAELYYNISKIIPDGDFNVSIRSKENTYVLIGVEKHPFLY